MPYTETPSHGPNFTQPPLDLIDGKEEYEVEQIRFHRTWGQRRTLQYLIKWKGYPESDNTWENANQIHAPTLIKLYHQTSPQTSLKGRRARLEGKHSPILSPPKALSRSLSSSTILRDSTAALVWPKAHEINNRSACNPSAPLVSFLSDRWTHTVPPSFSMTSMGNLSTLQTSIADNNNSPSDPPHHNPVSSTPCPLSPPTMPQTNRHARHPSSSHLILAHPLQCLSPRAPSAPPCKPSQTSTTACYAASPTDYSRQSPIERRAPVWPPNGTKTKSTTWSNKCSTTSRHSTSPLWATSSMLGRSVTSRSQLATDYTGRPSGYISTTMAPSPAITAPRGPTNSPSLSTYMPPDTVVYPRLRVICTNWA
jgi:Chromo (CHRromatin Organisation MOdifier) domain